MLEKRIEKYVFDELKKMDGIALKLVSPTMDSLPDRLILLHGKIWFREFKKPGKKPTPKQWVRMRQLIAMGFDVDYIDTMEKAEQFVNEIRTA